MELQYRLIRSRRRKKTLSLKVMGTGDIVIHAPHFTPEREIAAFFSGKEAWVRERLRLLREAPAVPLPGPLKAGDSLFFLGASYPLVLDDSEWANSLFAREEGRFVLHARVLHSGRALVRSWYEEQARVYFPRRVDHYARLWNLPAAGIRISRARQRWGSCSSRNVLAFSWRLMMAPPPVVDYVVIHELAHIREKSHKGPFWALVGKMMPDYVLHRQWLKKNGHLLTV